jgi:hypothetical protein
VGNLLIRDSRTARPCLLSLNYPMLDDRNETPSSFQVTDIGIWVRRENLLAWAAVLGDRAGIWHDFLTRHLHGRGVDGSSTR